MKKRDYNNFDFASLVKIDDTSPSGLSWIAPRLYGGRLSYKRLGNQAGSVRDFNNRQSYFVITVYGLSFFVHRIIYVLKHGFVDIANDIDHIDGNSLNNSIENLREITPAMNSRNTKRKKGKELSTGIYLEEYIAKSGNPLSKIRAHYSVKGVVYSRSWSVLNRGYSEALELAIKWRKEQIAILNAEGAGYTDRHGT